MGSRLSGLRALSRALYKRAGLFLIYFRGERPRVRKRRRQVSQGRMENLGRGLVAMRTGEGIFISWRMFLTEDHVYGTASSPMVYTLLRDGAVIATLEGKTNYIDKEGTLESVYSVRMPSGEECEGVRPFSSGSNWFDIPLVRPSDSPYGPYTINDVSAGDLDGDGEYELVVKWDSAGKDNSEPGFTGNVLLDAYKLDGTKLWEHPIDLGVNIRAGAHYTQFLVYDFNRDGRSEIVMKTAPGSKDGKGHFVSEASREDSIRSCDNTADYRDSRGMVLEGEEFLTVFDGRTGKALDTIDYPNKRIDSAMWGDTAGNRSERYLAAVAWLDGKRPYAFFMRGYYWGRVNPCQARQGAFCVSFDGVRFGKPAVFDTSSPASDGHYYKGIDGYRKGNERFLGEGNHNCVVADVDGDGRDEVLTGTICYKMNRLGKIRVKWCGFLGHGDALHIMAPDPEHAVYDYFTVHECGGWHPIIKGKMLDHGMSVFEAGEGKTLFHVDSPGDMGRGMMADVGAGGKYQFWGVSEVEGSDERVLIGPFTKTDHGFEKMDIPGVSANFRIFWDGDLYDELLDGKPGEPLEVTSWNGKRMERIFTTEGCVSINGTKANPCLQADILGDWREEIVMAREDNEALRVFVSDIPSGYSLMTLMHDPVYRAGVAAEQTGYNQPPHVGFCLNKP